MNEQRNSSPISSSIISGEYGTPTSPARASSTTLCTVETVAPPTHLPAMIAVVLTGATSISRRNPNSRSQTIEMPENAAVNPTDIASTPGNKNAVNFTDPP